jgi:hypothetical protein
MTEQRMVAELPADCEIILIDPPEAMDYAKGYAEMSHLSRCPAIADIPDERVTYTTAGEVQTSRSVCARCDPEVETTGHRFEEGSEKPRRAANAGNNSIRSDSVAALLAKESVTTIADARREANE